MLWLSRMSADTPYLTGVALPMLLIGLGQGAALGPLTAAGITGVAAEDAGAASGVVNVAHQLGGSLGLAIMVTVFAAVGLGAIEGQELLAHRIGGALTAGTVMLALALAVVVTWLVRPGSRGPAGARVPDAEERRKRKSLPGPLEVFEVHNIVKR
jgi:sugar phosphate permease